MIFSTLFQPSLPSFFAHRESGKRVSRPLQPHKPLLVRAVCLHVSLFALSATYTTKFIIRSNYPYGNAATYTKLTNPGMACPSDITWSSLYRPSAPLDTHQKKHVDSADLEKFDAMDDAAKKVVEIVKG